MESHLLTATKEYSWAMAHMLDGHEGLCKNLHGHEYKLQVTVARIGAELETSGPAKGMIVDFKELKEIVNRLIVSPLDHATMVYSMSADPFEIELRALLLRYKKKRYDVKYRPTAENMAKDFFAILNEPFDAIGLRIINLRLYETPTSYAEISI